MRPAEGRRRASTNPTKEGPRSLRRGLLCEPRRRRENRSRLPQHQRLPKPMSPKGPARRTRP